MTSETSEKNVLLVIEKSIAVVTINREKQLNALNQQVLNELKIIFQQLAQKVLQDPLSIKGVILVGSGEKAFVAGADIKAMNDMPQDQLREFAQLGQDVTFLVEEFPRTVVACVHGFALGGGCELAMSADFILATNNSIFGQPEVKLGLIPGFGGTQRLSKLIGRQRAKELVYTGRNIDAVTAQSWGLVLNLYANKTQLLEAAQGLIEKISENSLLAVDQAKKSVNKGIDLPNQQGLKIEFENFLAVFNSNDRKEGTEAFIQKRAPQFTGK